MRKLIPIMSMLVITILVGCLSPVDSINEAIKSIKIPTEVSAEFSLPTKGIYGVSLEYSSSGPEIFLKEKTATNYNFAVNRQLDDVNVILTVTFYKDGEVAEKEYSVRVLKIEEDTTVTDYLALAIQEFNKFIGLAPITFSENKALPASMASGHVVLSYSSSNLDSMIIETSSGDIIAEITRKTANVSLTLTVNFHVDGESPTDTKFNLSKDYQVTIPKLGDEPDDGKYIKNANHAGNKLYSNILLDEFGWCGLPSIDATNPNNVVNENVLVIPVEFPDYKFPAGAKAKIEKGFFGTEAQTGWESLKTYYAKSSYGKIVFGGLVLDIFTTSQNSSYYAGLENGEQTIIKQALTYFNPTIQYSEFDINNDDCIDAIYLIYARPMVHEEANANDDFWWAWTYQYYQSSSVFDGVEPGYYVWQSYHFFDEAFISYSGPSGYKQYIDVNSTTLIHETGHLFGLDDYYDYDTSTGPDGGLGGFDMMDYNAGDHNSFSKIMLGWTIPMIVQNTITIDLKPFESSGEVLLLPASWKASSSTSYFSEYLLVEYYTPTGLNEALANGDYLFENAGVKIFHVDATLNNNTGPYWYMHANNNSDTPNKLIKYVEADGNNSIEKLTGPTNGWAADSDLFHAGNSLLTYSWYQTYSGSKNVKFKIDVISITTDYATIKVTY